MSEHLRTLVWKIPKKAVFDFVGDNAFRYSAAMAFYTMLSLAPIIILVLGVTSIFVETHVIKTELLSQIRDLIGREGAGIVSTVLRNAEESRQSASATTFGVGVLILGATAVFAQLQDALNEIWGVQTKPKKEVFSFLLTRLVSFGMVLAVGFLLLASLLITTAITTLSTHLSIQLPGGESLWEIVDITGSVVIATLLFSMIFRFVPDVKIAWGDVLVGAFITALLFTLGKSLIGGYIGRSSVSSVYGAAGSLVVLLFWVYYTSLAVFFGAELAQAYTRFYGSQIEPRRFGMIVKNDPIKEVKSEH